MLIAYLISFLKGSGNSPNSVPREYKQLTRTHPWAEAFDLSVHHITCQYTKDFQTNASLFQLKKIYRLWSTQVVYSLTLIDNIKELLVDISVTEFLHERCGNIVSNSDVYLCCPVSGPSLFWACSASSAPASHHCSTDRSALPRHYNTHDHGLPQRCSHASNQAIHTQTTLPGVQCKCYSYFVHISYFSSVENWSL